MKISLVSIEDGLDCVGFRKFSSFVCKIHPKTDIFYITTGNYRSLVRALLPSGSVPLQPDDIEVISERLAIYDIVGFSSMSQHAAIVAEIIHAIRRRNPKVFVVWGGIHPIIHPEDAIKHADAVCTGEGEFAFATFLDLYKEGLPVFEAPSFWFNSPNGIVRNANRQLMTGEEMDQLPLPAYQDGEYLYHKKGGGFAPIREADFIEWAGLGYNTVWSIGCPMRCTYCGNSKFIDYDIGYRKIRHSSPTTIIAELKAAITKHPHISTIVFHDDSFLALPISVLEEFCRLYRNEINRPFVVGGVIPNYVREDKLRLLIATGLIRVRMGIQSGSQSILDFYERPVPISRIRDACRILNLFKSDMIPPAFDVILDNPLETTEDVHATLDLLYELPRPFTLNVFSLRVIPNTRMAEAFEKRGINVDSICINYLSTAPSLANVMVYLIATFSLPRGIYLYMRNKAFPFRQPQPEYRPLLILVRLMLLSKRALNHLVFMDFSVLPGKIGFFLWKLGVVQLWRRHL